jgi:hypothetical protein
MCNRCDCNSCRDREMARRRDPHNRRHGTRVYQRRNQGELFYDRIMDSVMAARVSRRISLATERGPWGALITRG